MENSEDGPFMAESASRYDMTSGNQSSHTPASDYSEQLAVNQAPVIWTPRFIIIFAIVLVIGLSVAATLTQGWSNAYYSVGKILLIYTLPILLGWGVLAKQTRSSWTRLGALVGCLWTVLAGIYFWYNRTTIDPTSPLALTLYDALRCALLVCYICLSLAYTSANRWDTWFFRIAPILFCAIVAVQMVHKLHSGHVIGDLEQVLSSKALYFSLFIWWLRPACWKRQPGPALLFGLVPFLQLTMILAPNITEIMKVFLTQASLLCMLLGILRLLQYERRR